MKFAALCFNIPSSSKGLAFFALALILGIQTFLLERVAGAADATSSFREIFRSGCEIDYPPFCFADDKGAATGFSVELLQATLQAMDRNASFRVAAWDQIKDSLEKGELQILPLVGRTPERESVFDFTFPYMSLHGAIVIRSDDNEVNSLADLKGKQVAVMKGDNAEEFLRREDCGVTIHTTSTFEQALRELSEGRHDAVVIQRLVGLRLLKDMGLPNLKIANKPIEDFRQDFCFAVREGDRDTLALLNEGLSLVMADDTYRRLHTKWFAALELPSDRRIVIGGASNYPPYEYLDEKGQPTGYNVELTRAIAQVMDLDVEIRLSPWSEIRRQLQEGEIDAIHGMFFSLERDRAFDFSSPHTLILHSSVVRQGTGKPPATLKELAGKRLVVMQGDIMHDYLVEKGLQDQVETVPSQEDALRRLAAGNYDCALIAHLPALYWIKKNGWSNLVVGQASFLSPEYCYAVTDGNKALLAKLGEGLKVLESTGEYRRIYEKWLGVYEQNSFPLRKALRYFALIIIPLLLILLASLVWSMALRRQVANRTKELQESKNLLATILDAIAVPVFYKDIQGVYLGCNQALISYLGKSKDSILGMKVQDLSKELTRLHQEKDQILIQTQSVQVYEADLTDSYGTRRHVVIHKAPFRDSNGAILGIVGIMLDITQLKQAQESLRSSEESHRATLYAIGDGVIATDDKGCIAIMNPVAEKLTGWILRDAAGKPLEEVFRIINAHSRLPLHSPMAKVLATGQTVGLANHTILIARNGQERHIADSAAPIFNDRNDVNGVVMVFRDVTTEYKAAEALRLSELKFHSAFQTSPYAITLTRTDDGQIVEVNDAFLCVTGYTREDLIGRTLTDLHLWVREEDFHSVFHSLLNGVSIKSREFNFRKKNNENIIGLFSAQTFQLNHERYILSSINDITEKKRSEEERQKLQTQLHHAQRMESVGRLAGGVAHDFNNMLSVILGHTELALCRIHSDDSIAEDLLEIKKAAERSANLTHQLLAYARKQPILPRVLDLNEALKGMLQMLRRLIGENIDLSLIEAESLWPIKMDPSQIDQILANLCVNSRDAIAGVGKIVIKTENANCHGYLERPINDEESYFVLLTVVDNGGGMDQQVLDNLFEPFFTTKGIGQGTGLGLATIYGIVKQNNGFIQVESEPGKGTTFRIFLPRYSGNVSGLETESKKETPVSRGETVLLVEDEPAILNICKKILEELNYRVLVAETPKVSIRLAQEYPEQIHLLITDVIMPEMSGQDLAKNLQNLRPCIKCLYMSGYTADVIANRGFLDAGVHFVQKPFTRQQLAIKVREVLDRD